eukprot:TRINITY_DN5235_c0_g2_i2.p1 TRINITY_DN5235_c0_g2~~TRINITY_DN5235_c0_g2_i2.p1  ORF type:complete len:549 (-),score=119.23 TRINITY_DN5235_c0_g2_i2:145-1791(-)
MQQMQVEEVNEEESQAAFFRREAARRWYRYFSKAHETLDAAGMSVDAVQVYHLLYEVINQLVGGIQLAAQADTSPAGSMSGAAASPNGEPGAFQAHSTSRASSDVSEATPTKRAAFLSAAMVLARMAEASKGTPLELEDFEAQASAAVSLSCMHQPLAQRQGGGCQDLATWLQIQEAATPPAEASANGWAQLQAVLQRRNDESAPEGSAMDHIFQRSWHMYSEDLSQAVWRPAMGHAAETEDGGRSGRSSTFNPLDDEQVAQALDKVGDMWQIFPTYVMSKQLSKIFSSSDGSAEGCQACRALSRIALTKYDSFKAKLSEGGKRAIRQDEVNNAFFSWQLTHESEQEDAVGQDQWPELYRDSEDFLELKRFVKLACLEYLRQIYNAPLSALDLAQLELSIWASVTPPNEPGSKVTSGTGADDDSKRGMGLAYHDHPLALLSGVFYAQAGGKNVLERTPTVFADPRGTTPFRYTRSMHKSSSRDEEVEPTAPFHRLAYAHAKDGLAIVFPSWLVHGVPSHEGRDSRVVFAFNLHTLHGTTLSSWAKTTL